MTITEAYNLKPGDKIWVEGKVIKIVIGSPCPVETHIDGYKEVMVFRPNQIEKR